MTNVVRETGFDVSESYMLMGGKIESQDSRVRSVVLDGAELDIG